MDRPSGSTFASVGLGIPVAVVLSWLVSTFGGVEVPGPVEAAVGAIISSMVGYFFTGGKAVDTE